MYTSTVCINIKSLNQNRFTTLMALILQLKKAKISNDLLIVPDVVLRVGTREIPPFPGCKLIILTNGHLQGGCWSLRTNTSVPSLIGIALHLYLRWSWDTYFLTNLIQNCWNICYIIFWIIIANIELNFVKKGLDLVHF